MVLSYDPGGSEITGSSRTVPIPNADVDHAATSPSATNRFKRSREKSSFVSRTSAGCTPYAGLQKRVKSKVDPSDGISRFGNINRYIDSATSSLKRGSNNSYTSSDNTSLNSKVVIEKESLEVCDTEDESSVPQHAAENSIRRQFWYPDEVCCVNPSPADCPPFDNSDFLLTWQPPLSAVPRRDDAFGSWLSLPFDDKTSTRRLRKVVERCPVPRNRKNLDRPMFEELRPQKTHSSARGYSFNKVKHSDFNTKAMRTVPKHSIPLLKLPRASCDSAISKSEWTPQRFCLRRPAKLREPNKIILDSLPECMDDARRSDQRENGGRPYNAKYSETHNFAGGPGGSLASTIPVISSLIDVGNPPESDMYSQESSVHQEYSDIHEEEEPWLRSFRLSPNHEALGEYTEAFGPLSQSNPNVVCNTNSNKHSAANSKRSLQSLAHFNKSLGSGKFAASIISSQSASSPHTGSSERPNIRSPGMGPKTAIDASQTTKNVLVKLDFGSILHISQMSFQSKASPKPEAPMRLALAGVQHEPAEEMKRKLYEDKLKRVRRKKEASKRGADDCCSLPPTNLPAGFTVKSSRRSKKVKKIGSRQHSAAKKDTYRASSKSKKPRVPKSTVRSIETMRLGSDVGAQRHSRMFHEKSSGGYADHPLEASDNFYDWRRKSILRSCKAGPRKSAGYRVGFDSKTTTVGFRQGVVVGPLPGGGHHLAISIPQNSLHESYRVTFGGPLNNFGSAGAQSSGKSQHILARMTTRSQLQQAAHRHASLNRRKTGVGIARIRPRAKPPNTKESIGNSNGECEGRIVLDSEDEDEDEETLLLRCSQARPRRHSVHPDGRPLLQAPGAVGQLFEPVLAGGRRIRSYFTGDSINDILVPSPRSSSRDRSLAIGLPSDGSSSRSVISRNSNGNVPGTRLDFRHRSDLSSKEINCLQRKAFPKKETETHCKSEAHWKSEQHCKSVSKGNRNGVSTSPSSALEITSTHTSTVGSDSAIARLSHTSSFSLAKHGVKCQSIAKPVSALRREKTPRAANQSLDTSRTSACTSFLSAEAKWDGTLQSQRSVRRRRTGLQSAWRIDNDVVRHTGDLTVEKRRSPNTHKTFVNLFSQRLQGDTYPSMSPACASPVAALVGGGELTVLKETIMLDKYVGGRGLTTNAAAAAKVRCFLSPGARQTNRFSPSMQNHRCDNQHRFGDKQSCRFANSVENKPSVQPLLSAAHLNSLEYSHLLRPGAVMSSLTPTADQRANLRFVATAVAKEQTVKRFTGTGVKAWVIGPGAHHSEVPLVEAVHIRLNLDLLQLELSRREKKRNTETLPMRPAVVGTVSSVGHTKVEKNKLLSTYPKTLAPTVMAAGAAEMVCTTAATQRRASNRERPAYRYPACCFRDRISLMEICEISRVRRNICTAIDARYAHLDCSPTAPVTTIFGKVSSKFPSQSPSCRTKSAITSPKKEVATPQPQKSPVYLRQTERRPGQTFLGAGLAVCPAYVQVPSTGARDLRASAMRVSFSANTFEPKYRLSPEHPSLSPPHTNLHDTKSLLIGRKYKALDQQTSPKMKHTSISAIQTPSELSSALQFRSCKTAEQKETIFEEPYFGGSRKQMHASRTLPETPTNSSTRCSLQVSNTGFHRRSECCSHTSNIGVVPKHTEKFFHKYLQYAALVITNADDVTGDVLPPIILFFRNESDVLHFAELTLLIQSYCGAAMANLYIDENIVEKKHRRTSSNYKMISSLAASFSNRHGATAKSSSPFSRLKQMMSPNSRPCNTKFDNNKTLDTGESRAVSQNANESTKSSHFFDSIVLISAPIHEAKHQSFSETHSNSISSCEFESEDNAVNEGNDGGKNTSSPFSQRIFEAARTRIRKLPRFR